MQFRWPRQDHAPGTPRLWKLVRTLSQIYILQHRDTITSTCEKLSSQCLSNIVMYTGPNYPPQVKTVPSQKSSRSFRYHTVSYYNKTKKKKFASGITATILASILNKLDPGLLRLHKSKI